MLRRITLLLLALSPLAPAQVERLRTADTNLVFNEGPNSPKLISVNDWKNTAPERLIDRANQQSITWRLRPALTIATATKVSFTYESNEPQLRLTWAWQTRSTHGPVEHNITIENLSLKDVWLPLQDSFEFHFRKPASEPLTQFFVEKGASFPSPEGTHLIPIAEGYAWTGTSSTYAHPPQGSPREIIPYLLVEQPNHNNAGWYIGIEFSGRTQLTIERHADTLSGSAGLNPEPGPYKTKLPPHAIFEAPPIFLGAFTGGPDAAGNSLRRWIRETLNNPLTLRNQQYPTLVSNSWGSGMAINEQQAHSMIRDAASLGLEMFHLDAGWFRQIGDWTPNPDKFPHGIAPVADFAHSHGLKFGLWTDWTQGGRNNINDAAIHSWLTINPPPDWKPAEFKGITMDLGVPEMRNWAQQLLTHLIADFHLDMLEHDGYLVAQGCDRSDHPHAPLDEGTARRFVDEEFHWVSGSNDTDVSYHATRAYYQVQAAMRRRFPNLLFEICNDGGRMVDFGSAAHGDYFSITDAYDPLGNRRAFYDASYVLPPAMLENYVEKWKDATTIPNFLYMLRSGLMGWFSLMQDSNAWNSEQHEAAKKEFVFYKQTLRPLIRTADLYHVSPRPDGVHWDGIEYMNPQTGQGAMYVFRGSAPDEPEHTFNLRGLNPRARYKIDFHDRSSAASTATGAALMQAGIVLQLTQPNTSEILVLTRLN